MRFGLQTLVLERERCGRRKLLDELRIVEEVLPVDLTWATNPA
jgi:hypothetical protein